MDCFRKSSLLILETSTNKIRKTHTLSTGINSVHSIDQIVDTNNGGGIDRFGSFPELVEIHPTTTLNCKSWNFG